MSDPKSRLGLQLFSGKRINVTGRFSRWGDRPHLKETACLEDVCFGEQVVAEHVWVKNVTALTPLDPQRGDRLSMQVTVYSYPKSKGGAGGVIDYALRDPSDVQILSRPTCYHAAPFTPPQAPEADGDDEEPPQEEAPPAPPPAAAAPAPAPPHGGRS